MLIHDLQVAEVVDFPPGSGAACPAAFYSNVPYIGVPYNEAHETWLVDLMQKMFVGLVVESKVAADKELINKVQCYLNRAVEAAKHMLPKETSAFGDSLTGEDDSDLD